MINMDMIIDFTSPIEILLFPNKVSPLLSSLKEEVFFLSAIDSKGFAGRGLEVEGTLEELSESCSGVTESGETWVEQKQILN